MLARSLLYVSQRPRQTRRADTLTKLAQTMANTVNTFLLSLILLLAAVPAAAGAVVGQPVQPPAAVPVVKAAAAASLSGTVSDENGQPIAGSSLCLSWQNADPAAAPSCLQTQASDASGHYTFNQVAAGAYVVTISDDRFPAFTWLPAARKLSVTAASGALAGLNFKKQFSFSNFQKPASFNAADLPELAGFNLAGETVFVKVYAVDPANPAQQMVFFIGRLTSEAHLKFAASAPWTVKEVIYEIFSPTAARQGSLLLQS